MDAYFAIQLRDRLQSVSGAIKARNGRYLSAPKAEEWIAEIDSVARALDPFVYDEEPSATPWGQDP